jgi:hypothetical protein
VPLRLSIIDRARTGAQVTGLRSHVFFNSLSEQTQSILLSGGVGAVSRGLSENEFNKAYGAKERCHAALAEWRGPNGFECPDCMVTVDSGASTAVQ